MQFQYKVVVESPEDLEEQLNAAGEEGYELVAAVPNADGSVTAILEVEIEDEDDEEDDEEDDDALD